MSELQISSGDQSPFDDIRRVTPEGREFWSARELMPLLGYEKWERFADAIGRAKIAAHNSGYVVAEQFPGAGKMVELGSGASRRVDDYHLSRYACYLVAMSSDARKPEVAAALTYFAIKTREAETRRELTEDEIVHQALTITTRKVEALTAENKMLAAAIERDAPLVAKAEAHTGSNSSVHRQEFAREVMAWGRKQNIEIRQEHVMRFLGHIGLFIRGERTDTGHATADAMKRGLAWTDKGTAKNGHAWATGKLTARGQDYAWKRITKYVGEHRTLELPRELRGGEPA
ncbi:phage antirepressor KilAC domain-containing protein [Mycolicibacterium conceptionense]|uniref:phage antirepressor KilAC domain-containing protein n=1 Tax=Mycolicibacterium conceptionense TaxID=451644 RepID=UPI0007EDBB39|nr:phage antirepressor KilAC domain-containing protein [Mycolicibacterium conceptionense]OBK09050.1 hypothetical protein A5639_12015 [Mycolicibacterium conceptionense]